jgi:large subunit ribosomal protein L3
LEGASGAFLLHNILMINTLLGSKQHMSQAFVEGTRVPVTWIKAGPCIVTQVKTVEKDGYWSVQLGFAEKRIKNVTKPLQGHLKGAVKDNKAPRFLREVRLETESDLKVGDIVKLTQIFKKGDVVSVAGTSKGKGFAGVVKRWHFAGGPKTHGQSDRHRAPGSIGQGTTPGRVLKGKHMAGRMGSDRVTVKNLIVVDVNAEKELIAVSGPVPGVPGGLLEIKKLKSGSLEDLVEEAPEVVEQVEEEGTDVKKENTEKVDAKGENTEKDK